MICPKCNFEQDDSRLDCLSCGIIFAKFADAHYKAPAIELGEAESVSDETFETADDFIASIQRLSKKGLISISIGAALALVVMNFNFLSFVFRYFLTLVHEFGHAIAGWLFGYPSIPAFDFVYGGGITMHDERTMGIVYAVYVGFAVLFITYRKNKLSLLILSGLTIFYSIFAFTNAHKVLNLFMGHGAELIFAGIFIYRAMSGTAVVHKIERPLYGFIGFFMLFSDYSFAYRLMTSVGARAEYAQAKGGGHWMDFSQIANNYFHTNLNVVATMFFLLCLLTPVLVYLWYRYEQWIISFLIKALKKSK